MFPRVANRLAIAWPDPKAVQEVLDDVLIDRRGGRQGFPPAVQQELLRLGTLVGRRPCPGIQHEPFIPARSDRTTTAQ
jgi:hypothetical protein